MTDQCPYLNRQDDSGAGPGRPDFYEEEGISLKELLLVLFRGKKIIVWTTIAVLLATLVGTAIVPKINIVSKGTVQTAVQLYFSGIELGETPNGTEYDVNEIKSAEIIRNALDNIDFGSQKVSLEKLKSNISFQAVVPDSVAKTLENLKDIKDDNIKIERLENLKGYSNIYIVKLNLANDLGLDTEQGRVVLDNIIQEYKKHLIDQYGDTAVLANVFADDFDLDQYDYIQAADILNGQLERMETYVQVHIPQTSVHSTVTGLNPADISSALESIRTVDMERVYTLIAAFYLTKDPNRVVAVYEQLAEDKEKAAAQYTEEAAALKSAIASFKKDQQTIVMGGNNSAPINLTTENKQYNAFVSQYIEAGTKAVNASEDAKYYRSEAERFRAALPTTRENSLKAAETEDSIKLLQKKLIYWTDKINETATDYYSEATYQKYAEQLMPAKAYNGLETGPSLPLAAAIGFVLGLLLGILIVLFRAYLKDDLKKMNQEVAK